MAEAPLAPEMLNFDPIGKAFAPANKSTAEYNVTVKQTVQMFLLQKMSKEARDVIVDYILKNQHIITERQDENPPMFRYNGAIYVPEARTYIREICEFLCGAGYTRNISNEVIARVESKTYMSAEELYAVQEPYLVACLNGLLDVRTNKLSAFSPSKIFFTQIPVKFNPEAECPLIKKFIGEVVNEGDVKLIQEQFGYTLIRAHPIPKAFLYTGDGRNGKGTVISLQKEFLGAMNVTAVSLQDISEDQYAAGELFNKLACLGGDLSASGLKDTAMFKQLTGGDLIAANRKFMTRLYFRNYAKLIFAANKVPYTNDASEGFFARWIPLDFPHKFYTSQEIALMTEEERKGVRVADRNILEKLTTPQELSGLLNWALEGLTRILEKGSFSSSLTTEKIKQIYQRKSNSLASFAEDHCNFDNAEAQTSREEFRNAYLAYCVKHNVPERSDKAVARFMKDNEVFVQKSGSTRNWIGLTLDARAIAMAYEKVKPADKTTTTLASFVVEKTLSQTVIDFLRTKNKGEGVTVDYLQKKFPEVTDEFLRSMEEKGDVYVPKPGWVRAV